MKLAASLTHVAALLEATDHPVQASGVDAHRLARLGDRDARPLVDQREELLVAPARAVRRRARVVAVAPSLSGAVRGRRRAGAAEPLAGAPQTPCAGRGRMARVGPGDDESMPRRLGHDRRLAILRHCRLELLGALGDALLGVAKFVQEGEPRVATVRVVNARWPR